MDYFTLYDGEAVKALLKDGADLTMTENQEEILIKT
jgi:hypothetical protein